jgi:ABC-type transport system involved in multi-copper enzyme maturation permease subunit
VPLDGNGSITVRMTSLTGLYNPNGGISGQAGQSPLAGMKPGLQSWSKAGILIKDGTRPGSAYAAMMVTGSHGVRMQDNFTRDTAGRPGTVSAASPRWLRLTRSGDTLTGYDSADGTRWTQVGTATLAGLPATAQIGLFAASPGYQHVTSQSFTGSSATGGPTQATGVFDHVSVQGASPGGAWTASQVGSSDYPEEAQFGEFHQSGGTFTVAGSGDIAPAVRGGMGDAGTSIEKTLTGAFAGLIAMVVVGTMFITAEYRRGLIRLTLAASPRRGRVLAAKAIVIGAVTFVAGLAAAAVAVPLGERFLRENGNFISPVTTLTEARVMAGTAALLAVAAILALGVGAVLRRSAGAVTAVIAAIVLPYILATGGFLPAGASEWLVRVTPAAAFAIQQTSPQYPQVSAAYTPSTGYYPLAPWAGFAVLCAWAALALGLAVFLLRRRDA